MNNGTHIAWDFDGTIIDCFSPLKQATERYCRTHSLVLPDDRALRASFGNPSWGGFEAWPIPIQIQDRHRYGIYSKFYEIQKATPDQFPMIPGIQELIAKLKEDGFLQSIVTSRPREALLAMLSHHNLDRSFDHINSGDCAVDLGLRDKPNPDKLLHAIQAVGSDAGRTIVIGDTEMDVGMARSANCRIIGVTWGMGSREGLIQAGASHIASRTLEIRDILDGLK